jgi:polyisoprenyl-phosphate glycosyltransferase
VLLRKGMWDINAQPTLFTRVFFETWRDPPFDFSLDLFAYYQAKSARLRVRRFAARFGERAHGLSHWNINWRAKWKFIKRTVSYSLELNRRLGG